MIDFLEEDFDQFCCGGSGAQYMLHLSEFHPDFAYFCWGMSCCNRILLNKDGKMGPEQFAAACKRQASNNLPLQMIEYSLPKGLLTAQVMSCIRSTEKVCFSLRTIYFSFCKSSRVNSSGFPVQYESRKSNTLKCSIHS